ncbi:hypothetical protein J5N97_027099 [Dioscorea zingiberensis]|uniref:Heparanase-like protein 3 n=1 Tax=Dioscorea zingiberensis TaxID=325984 RepID=A0A9D5C3L2_9LILI|nr:hypothetical protein J5N97_027099 [Dioscorea zingiberensis]
MAKLLLYLATILFWPFFFSSGPLGVCCQSNGVGRGVDGSGEGVVSVNGLSAIGRTDPDFVCATLDWWPPEKCDYGTCSWGLASLLNLNLSSKILLNAVKAFSPLKLRLGGSLQDKVIYGTGDAGQPCTLFIYNSSEMFGFSQGCLPMSRWDELNDFFKKSGAVIIFGLNALNGRIPLNDGSVGGPWNSTNAAGLIRYTVNKGYTIHGWELRQDLHHHSYLTFSFNFSAGNELSGSGVGTRISADQYAADTIALKSIVDEIYRGFSVKPLVLAPGGFFDANWFTKFISKMKPRSLDAITHHIYNLGPGVDTHLIDKILDPSYLNGEASTFSSLQSILTSAGTSTTAWVGEAGGAYNSGHNLVTNAFVFSFWYLDQLGMSSSYDTKTYCRQSFIGGNYGLLNTTTYKPNPDYYSALLWHRLMGQNVLSASFNGSKKIRAYAHCTRDSEGITVLLINLDGNTTTKVFVTSQNAFMFPDASKDGNGKPRRRFHHIPRFWGTIEYTRDEYHLTAKDGNLQSQTMLLNNNVLEMDSNGNIPPLTPIKVNMAEPITVAPYSIVFAHIPHFYAPACR